jgi:hypothetical protein
VILLSDLRDIFNRTGADRMASADLITACSTSKKAVGANIAVCATIRRRRT